MSQSTPPRRLVFHIGDHKAGSTTIQTAFASGHVKIVDRKIIYPSAFNHNYLKSHFNSLRPGGRLPPSRDGQPNLREISDRLASEEYEFAVLSGESFEAIDPGLFARGAAHFFLPHVHRMRIVDYIRPHAARTLSSFAEQTKIGRFGASLPDYHHQVLKSRRFVYQPRLAKWQDQFGSDFVARPMVRDVLKNASLLDDFIDAGFGPGLNATFSKNPTANEALTVEDLALSRFLQSQLPGLGKKLRHKIGWTFQLECGALRSHTAGTKLALDKSTAELMRSAYLEDARALDRGVFADAPVMERELDRSVDTAIAAPQSLEIGDYFSPEAVRAITLNVRMLAAVMDEDHAALATRLHARHIAAFNGSAKKEQAHRQTLPRRAPKAGPSARQIKPRAASGLLGPLRRMLRRRDRHQPSGRAGTTKRNGNG